MREVDLLKSGTVRDGSIYVSQDLGGEHVEFAAKLGAEVDAPKKNVGEVEFIQCDMLDTGLVYENGYVNLSTDYNGEEVTIAIRKVEAEEPEEAHVKDSVEAKATG